jgi:hypothetical protein
MALDRRMQQLDTQRSAFISAAVDAHYAASGSHSSSSSSSATLTTAAAAAAAAATDAFTSLHARAQRYGQWLQEEKRRATRVSELQCEANWCRALTAQDERGRTALMYAAGTVKSSSSSKSNSTTERAGSCNDDDAVLAALLQVRNSVRSVVSHKGQILHHNQSAYNDALLSSFRALAH